MKWEDGIFYDVSESPERVRAAEQFPMFDRKPRAEGPRCQRHRAHLTECWRCQDNCRLPDFQHQSPIGNPDPASSIRQKIPGILVVLDNSLHQRIPQGDLNSAGPVSQLLRQFPRQKCELPSKGRIEWIYSAKPHILTRLEQHEMFDILRGRQQRNLVA